MTRGHDLDLVSVECCGGLRYSIFGGWGQVHGSKNGMDGWLPGQLRDVIHRVDDTRMRTAEHNDQTGLGFNAKGLVVHQEICLRVALDEKKGPPVSSKGVRRGIWPVTNTPELTSVGDRVATRRQLPFKRYLPARSGMPIAL